MQIQTAAPVGEFSISDRREILFYLRQITISQEPVEVNLNEGSERISTLMLDVNEKDNIFVFEFNGDAQIRQRLLACPRATFMAFPKGVHTEFQVGGLRSAQYGNRPAMAANIPTQFRRLQRRAFPRLQTTGPQPRPCVFRTASPDRAWALSYADIGLGGIALETNDTTIPFTAGNTLKHVIVDMGKFGQLNVDLEVRARMPIAHGPKPGIRLCCSFVSLSTPQQFSIQNYINAAQREERLKTTTVAQRPR